MRISNLGQVNPVVTGAILDATLPATSLSKNTVRVGGGPDASSLLLLGAALFVSYLFISSSPVDPRGTIRGL